jgi:hypothetical protein
MPYLQTMVYGKGDKSNYSGRFTRRNHFYGSLVIGRVLVSPVRLGYWTHPLSPITVPKANSGDIITQSVCAVTTKVRRKRVATLMG